MNTFNNDRPDCVLDGFEYLTTRTFDTSIEHVAKPESLASETGGDHMTESSSHVTDPDGHVTKSGRHGAEPGFLVCCSCSDNCSNRSKCECWQLTLEEAKVIGNSRYSVGYVHQRLKRPQHSAYAPYFSSAHHNVSAWCIFPSGCTSVTRIASVGGIAPTMW